MEYRILVDENLDPQTAVFLRKRGHDAVHVEEAKEGDEGPVGSIVEFVRENNYVVLTNDRDFTREERNRGLTILMVADDEARANEIAIAIDGLADVVPDAPDLPRVTWI